MKINLQKIGWLAAGFLAGFLFALLLFLVQPHPTQPIRRVPEWNLQPVAAIDDRAVGCTGALCYPDP